MSTSSYPLFICAYDRGADPFNAAKKKPYHWAFTVMTNSADRTGLAFQLRGMPGGFYYSGEEETRIDGSENQVNELEIGAVPSDKYPRFKQLLDAAPVIKDESSKWNCQDWSLEVLDRLREEGFIAEGYTNQGIQYWFREEQ